MLQGAQIQLHARGPQDEMLTGGAASNPYTRTCWPRCTRFALDQRRDPFPETFRLGSSNSATIPRSGDLVGDVFLEIRLPVVPGATNDDRWVERFGRVLLRRVRLKIDETTVHDHERLWYDLDDALFGKASKTDGLHEMIGSDSLPMDEEHLIFIPLKFFFCKNWKSRQQFMPLLGIPGSSISLTIETESFDRLTTLAEGSQASSVESLDARLIIEYVHLDSPEKERVLRRPQAVLYEDVQDVEGVSYKLANDSEGGVRIPLDVVDVDMKEVNAPVRFVSFVSYLETDLVNELYFQYRDDIRRAELLANGVSLVSERDVAHFSTVEKYFRVDNTGEKNVMVHSFAMDASSWQPSGQLNFDRIARPVLRVWLKEKRPDVVVKAFVSTYKFMIFDKGRAMLKFI